MKDKKIVHTFKFSESDLKQALKKKGVHQWDAKAFREAMKIKSITEAVNHVIDNSGLWE